MRRTLTQAVEDYPNGFPRLAGFLNSDESFMVYRRFGYVFARLLLAKQDDIRRLEGLLNGMDKQDNGEGNHLFIKSHYEDARRETFPSAWGVSRVELLDQLETKAKDYGQQH